MSETPESGVSCLADLVRAAQLPEPAERKRIRTAAGVTLQRMADELGVSMPTVWHWERGLNSPSLENAVRYRRLLDELARAVEDIQAAS